MQLSRASLDWALGHALALGDTDIFPPAFEFKAIEHDWKRLAQWMGGQDLLHWRTRPFRRCLSPKHRYGFRIATQLDPLDFLAFTATVYEAGEELEATRVAPEIVHSYRFRPEANGTMFDPKWNYRSFTARSHQEAEQCRGGYVVVADIADFYSRIYSHRIENTLAGLTLTGHAKVIVRFLNEWAGKYSYGIPIGSSATRLIAEAILDDVDRGLLAEGVNYCRYNDDFRIFCGTHRQAHEHLALLATVLFENHGLTLQQHKTAILPAAVFLERYESNQDVEWRTLMERLDELGVGDPYNPMDPTELPDDIQATVAALNIEDLFATELRNEQVDISRTRFLLGRMTQFGLAEPLNDVLASIEKLYPVIPDVVIYLQRLPELHPTVRTRIGKIFLDLARDSTVAHLEFHRMWLLSVFATTGDWNNFALLPAAYGEARDDYTKRELMLALGVARHATWFRTRKRGIGDLGPWMRRAFIYGASCLPQDERHHWYRAIGQQSDELDRAVATWAEENPIA